jgi:prophage regulatory protein
MERKVNHQGELHFEKQRLVAQTKPQRILRLTQVRAITGLGRSFIYRLQTQKRCPQRIKIGARAVGWIEDEVLKWVADRVDQSRRDGSDTKRSERARTQHCLADGTSRSQGF